MMKDKKRYMIYEDVMREVCDVLEEYKDEIDASPGCLRSIHADKIKKVLHHFESGLYLVGVTEK